MSKYQHLKPFVAALMFSLCSEQGIADHIPVANDLNVLERYQYDASRKRFADIYKIALLLEEYIDETSTVPDLGELTGRSNPQNLYQVAILGQQEAVDHVMQNGTPFGFSLLRFDGYALIDALEDGLERDISLPIDPQKVGTTFSPTYFVFFRQAVGGRPPHYVVLGSFAQPVMFSTAVAADVHLVGITNLVDLQFVVPLIEVGEIDVEHATHIMSEGDLADEIFNRLVSTSID